jgi:hypothetical protein
MLAVVVSMEIASRAMHAAGRLKQTAPLCAVLISGPRQFAGGHVSHSKMERAMFLFLIITLPACVELAAWFVDRSFESYLLKLWPAAQTEEAE